jgi:hypothetical protein
VVFAGAACVIALCDEANGGSIQEPVSLRIEARFEDQGLMANTPRPVQNGLQTQEIGSPDPTSPRVIAKNRDDAAPFDKEGATRDDTNLRL